MRDLHILPKLRDSLSYLYTEHTIIQRYRQAVELVNKDGKTPVPIASLSVLLMGPGTSITHEAVKLLADNGCSIVWVGEEGTRFYAQGMGETRKGYRLLQQAALVSDADKHREVALRMYNFRFDEELDPNATIEEIRGHEGVRVRTLYQQIARRYGIKWKGRRYDRGNWDNSDPVNRSLSAANALLNGICHAAIVSGGYSPGLGFIHTGKQLSFVYDVADLYKAELTVPVAFQVAAISEEDVETRVRRRCREEFKKARLLKRILPDIDTLLNIHDDQDDAYDEDMALPGPLWDGAVEDIDLW